MEVKTRDIIKLNPKEFDGATEATVLRLKDNNTKFEAFVNKSKNMEHFVNFTVLTLSEKDKFTVIGNDSPRYRNKGYSYNDFHETLAMD
jgi:spermidine/putrescine-binding protein